MKITITDKKENLFLNRTELHGTIEFSGATTSNAQLAEGLAKQLHQEANVIVIKQIHTEFGQQKGRFLAYAYAQEKDRKKGEMMTKHLRKKLEETQKKAAEAAAAEKKGGE